MDYLQLSALTVTRAAGVNRPRSPWSQLSLAYCHPGQELAPSLNIEAGHQVHVEEDRDAGDEGDPGNLMWVILARDHLDINTLNAT